MFNNRVIQNAKWIVICKTIQSIIQLLIGMLSARFLGPSNYGLINYAASIVAFAVPVMQLGLGEILVREYVTDPSKEGEILGTSLVMNIVSSVLCICGVMAFARFANPGENETILVCFLYSLHLMFLAGEMTKYWFQAHLQSKYSSVAMLVAYLAVSVYKIYLLANGMRVHWFALSHAVEYGVVAIFLAVAYKRLGGPALKVSINRAKTLFARSKFYIVANLMVIVFQNVGPVILKMSSGSEENGFYSAALTCSIVVSFVYMAIVDSVRPTILASRDQSHEKFEHNVAKLYSLITYLTVLQSAGFALLAKPIVWLLYGSEYLPAVAVLRILTWQLTFSYFGAIRNIWILGEEKHNFLWIINLSGAIASLVLNLALIPLWGACGAALASVCVQIFTNFIMGFILKPIRENNRLLLKGLNPQLLWEMARELLRKQSADA